MLIYLSKQNFLLRHCRVLYAILADIRSEFPAFIPQTNLRSRNSEEQCITVHSNPAGITTKEERHECTEVNEELRGTKLQG